MSPKGGAIDCAGSGLLTAAILPQTNDEDGRMKIEKLICHWSSLISHLSFCKEQRNSRGGDQFPEMTNEKSAMPISSFFILHPFAFSLCRFPSLDSFSEIAIIRPLFRK